MDGVAAKISARAPKSRKDLTPKSHHFFYGFVWLLGWLLPPLAVVVRFGVGRDFFINVILTICGYFPGHAHNFYCQTIRNNKTKARTPKWAVKYGLVKLDDPRSGKHQWAHRYDERLPDSSRRGYGEGDSASISSTNSPSAWDGRGPEPARKPRKSTDHASSRPGHRFMSPWDDVVEPDEVEGGPRTLDRNGSGTSAAGAYDPIENEQFFESGHDTGSPLAPTKSRASIGSRKKSGKQGGIKGLMKHRSRYESSGPQETATNGDRFDRMAAARHNQQEEYQDDFERELNSGSASRPTNNNGGAARFDSFEREGPEDAWASTRPNNGPQSTARSNNADEDLFKHTF